MTTATTQVKKLIGRYFRLIDFHVFDHSEDAGSDEDSTNSDKSQAQFTIQMFGINESGETASIKINDYEPFFYVKVDLGWDQHTANFLLKELKKKNYINNRVLS